MANMSGYAAIQAEARRLGWPTSYRDDLEKHDREILTRNDAPQTFGWGIYDMGTNFYHPNSLENIYWACVRSQSGDAFYWYDGTQLTPASFNELLHQLIQTLDVTSYQQRFRVAQACVSQLWRPHFWTVDEAHAYIIAEQECVQAEQQYQEVTRLIGEQGDER